ncbi:MAG TPA: CvpA family protein [Bryobacteraceae bacterium]|nr:CvpA family protein [Bryobacteraceae bacterium]
MNWLDVVLLILVVGSAAAAFSKGITREVIGLVTVMAALILGAWFYGTAGAWLEPYLHSRNAANFCGFAIVFAGVMVAGSLFGALVARLMRLGGLSLLDRMLGFLFGALRGALVAVALVMALMAFTPGPKPPTAVVNSRLAPYVIDTAHVMAAAAPHELKDGFRRSYEQVKSMWNDTLKEGK